MSKVVDFGKYRQEKENRLMEIKAAFSEKLLKLVHASNAGDVETYDGLYSELMELDAERKKRGGDST